VDVCSAISDRDLGQMELLRYYHAQQDAAKGLPIANRMATVPQYASEALWKKAELLEGTKKYAQAIAAYREVDNPPDNVWRIAACYERLKKINTAVEELVYVENYFKQHAPEARLKIAYIYERAKMTAQFRANLRQVMTKYPESSQSRRAHEELERHGWKIGGGIDAED
jgi:TolA-binding protein